MALDHGTGDLHPIDLEDDPDPNDSMYDSERRRTSLINSIEKTTEILNQYMKPNKSINFSNVINLMNDSNMSANGKNFVSGFANQNVGKSSVPIDDLKE